MKYLIFILLVTTLPAFLSERSITITGIVTDRHDGKPVAGVMVSVQGSNTATTTGADGSFSITVNGTGGVLLFSCVGYEQQTVKIAPGINPLKIRLKRAVNKPEEVAKSYERRADSEAPVTALGGRAGGINVTKKRGNAGIYQQEEFNTEDYDDITENRFHETSVDPLSTFSIDVDGASYSNVRRFLQNGHLPPPGAVRIEELINYFHYDYPQPKDEHPFSINTEMADCPWNTKNKLVMIGLQGKRIAVKNLPPSNIVFLIDVSGSMQDENKLPLVKSSIKLLIEQLREEDIVSMVVYAGQAGLVLPPTSGSQKQKIRDAVEQLEAGGSTAGGQGIKLAYKVAGENFMKNGNNRVILCTDGDFNVGLSSDAALVELIEEERSSGVFLTVLGYGMGNYKDNKMQKLADKGNGNHAYIDNISEAKKVLVNEFGGTLFTIAKDVKLQVEFNPAKVQAYRLVGYENRMLNKEDFNNDKKDAGDIGSGHTVTALYELILVGVESDFIEKTDELKYQRSNKREGTDNEIMTIKFRYKKPDGNKSSLIVHTVPDEESDMRKASDNFRFVCAVAQFGMLMTDSEFKQGSSFQQARSLASGAIGEDEEGYRAEFLELISKAKKLSKDDGVSIHR